MVAGIMIGKSIGKYRVLEELGPGTLGVVYRAIDESVGREVAIKILSSELQGSEAMKRFMADAAALARLNRHEHTAIYKVAKSEHGLLVVMELVRGESLQHLAKLPGPLRPERAAYLTSQVLDALSHAHHAGVVHGDITPANLMLTDTRYIKIMGFGFARLVDPGRAADGPMTRTQAYLAPEQLLSQEIDARTDVYSCGVVLYELLTGMLPFHAGSSAELRQKQLHEAPIPLSAHFPDLPDWCERVVSKALAKAPADRFQTAEEFRAVLQPAPNSSSEVRTDSFAAIKLPVRASSSAIVPPASSSAHVPPPVPPPPVAPAPPSAHQASAVAPAPPSAQHASAVAPLPRTKLMTAVAALIAIVVAVIAYDFGAGLMRSTPPAAEVVPADANPAAASAAATPAAEAPATPATTAATPDSKASSAVPASKTTAPSTAGTSAAAPLSPTPVAPAAASASPSPVASGAAPPRSAPVAPAFPEMAFEAEAVVRDSDKFREREAKVVLANGTINVMQKDDKMIAGFPLSAVESISYSTARHPMWMSPGGPVELLKVEGGVFGIRRAGRNWIALRTKDAVQIIRVKDDDVQRVIAALEARSGRTADRVPEQKD